MKLLFNVAAMLVAALVAVPVWAELPPPSVEAKAKAAEAAAKAAHGSKVSAYQLCKSEDQVAAGYFAAAKKSGAEVPPALPTPPCVEPGPFVYAPAPAVGAAPAAPAASSPPSK